MDFTDIRQLMHDFCDLNIGKLSLELDDLKISLEKQQSSTGENFGSVNVTASPKVEVSVNEATTDDIKATDNEVAVCSPVVGSYYDSPSPDEPPFVTVGGYVEKGQTLCIVEAMKMMNEIPAPVSGKVSRIIAKPEGAVEYNQPLMFINTVLK
ncbi:MAG: acetyl-CoA carboxylase biotin carboxyl carrier protein [Oscillospiraceae bacterium]|nr:acetyl-CoA carboxylase biotin carboxyl carrier protein [Oscillospiraceae bacterium]MDD3833768.1 acetyl-CoA carboxylase biotin carboxyl carrier protein [Oscillospiraceae bacterium]